MRLDDIAQLIEIDWSTDERWAGVRGLSARAVAIDAARGTRTTAPLRTLRHVCSRCFPLIARPRMIRKTVCGDRSRPIPTHAAYGC